MRHQNNFRKFSRNASHRRAMLRNMATSFFLHEKIETTLPKAKDLRRVVEKMITDAFEDTVHRRRFAYGYLMDKTVVHKLFTEIAPRFKDRAGGYTRVIRTRVRAGDAAEMALIELLSETKSATKPASQKAKKAAKGEKSEAAAKAEGAGEEPSKKAAPKAAKAKSAAGEKKESTKKAAAPKKSKKEE